MAAWRVGGGWGVQGYKIRAVNLAETSTLIKVCKSVCSGERYRTIMVLLLSVTLLGVFRLQWDN